ncbi:MAG: ribonuclease III [Acidobacteriaceae bacterium]
MESSAHSSGTSIDTPALSEPAIADPGAAGELEVILEHRFAHPELLERAMTHSSLAHERGADEPQREDNETLEFLGDAVVGMVAAEAVYRRYPELTEGALTRLRGALVSRRHLAEVAAELSLGKYLLLGRGEERSGGRTKTALLANAMEAVIGAVYLDAGLEAARRLIEARVIAPMVDSLREQLTASGGMGDFKSALQELLQARKQGQPEYRTTGETGPDHYKRFFVEVRVGAELLAEGEGRTRKHAEQDAARQAIEKLQPAGEGE